MAVSCFQGQPSPRLGVPRGVQRCSKAGAAGCTSLVDSRFRSSAKPGAPGVGWPWGDWAVSRTQGQLDPGSSFGWSAGCGAPHIWKGSLCSSSSSIVTQQALRRSLQIPVLLLRKPTSVTTPSQSLLNTPRPSPPPTPAPQLR